jgi:hypothetical protein
VHQFLPIFFDSLRPRDVRIRRRIDLCVPKTSSMSCDLRVFVDHAAKAITPTDSELI